MSGHRERGTCYSEGSLLAKICEFSQRVKEQNSEEEYGLILLLSVFDMQKTARSSRRNRRRYIFDSKTSVIQRSPGKIFMISFRSEISICSCTAIPHLIQTLRNATLF